MCELRKEYEITNYENTAGRPFFVHRGVVLTKV